MTPEDKFFFMYLLTNPQVTQIGIYRITKKHIAFETGFSVETVQLLFERFLNQYKLIRYNAEQGNLQSRTGPSITSGVEANRCLIVFKRS